MKTSVIEVHDMLSVFSVDEVERRIGEVPGVESVTVNHSAGDATVRFDETRLTVTDIKSAVRQRGYDSATPVAGHAVPVAPVAPLATKAPAVPATVSADSAKPDKTAPAAPVAASVDPPKPDRTAPVPAGTASADKSKSDKAAPDARHQH